MFVASVLMAGAQAQADSCVKAAQDAVAPVQWDRDLIEDLPNGWQLRGLNFGKSSWAQRKYAEKAFAVKAVN